jgi:hypothetical protein
MFLVNSNQRSRNDIWWQRDVFETGYSFHGRCSWRD